MVEIEKKVPSNIEAEKLILGSMLIDPELAVDLESSFEVEDFYSKENQLIFKAIKSLVNQRSQVSAIAVLDELERMKEIENAGGRDYLYNVIYEIPVIDEVNDYQRIIKDKSLLRKLLNVSKKIYDEILIGKLDTQEILNYSESQINDIIKNKDTSKFVGMEVALDKTFEIIESKMNHDDEENKVLSGYKQLDEITHGLGRGALIILAARPSIGKSTFALNIATNVCEQGKRVAFFSLEMGYDQLVTKILAATSSIGMSKIISGQISNNEMSRLLVTKEKLKDYQIYFDDDSTTELGEIRSKCQELKREGGLDLIVIDYLQLLSVAGGGSNRVNEVGKISRGLKTMARSLDVPIIALSQLSRAVEKSDRADKTPILADLRESGSIEQDADIVMFLHRERQTDEASKVRSSKTDLIIAKNRNGETKTINLVFNGGYSKFSPYEEEE